MKGKKLNKLVNLKHKTNTFNYFNIILIISLLILIIIQIKHPFLTNTLQSLKSNIMKYYNYKYEIQNTKNDITKIEEDSLIRINMDQGGLDDINATTFKDKITRPTLMLQENILGEKVLKETFANLDNENIILKLFYTTSCSYSQQFMPIWIQIKESLPTYIKIEELNCAKKDNLGFSLCQKYKIKNVPTLLLIKPDKKLNETLNIKYNGKMDYLNIKKWLHSQNIMLEYNNEVEHFNNNVSIEKFNELQSGYTGNLGNMVLTADGNLRTPYDKIYRNATKTNEFGEFNDIDENGCPIANFSICNENSVNPGYQIFTHRGQWGCLYPDKNTSINNKFDAAFATVDHYLQSLPPKMEQVIGEDGKVSIKVSEYSADEKIEQMKKCANKYNKEIRNFGLCNNNKLNEKYIIKDRIERGEARLPYSDMNINEYDNTKETAEAIYNACSL